MFFIRKTRLELIGIATTRRTVLSIAAVAVVAAASLAVARPANAAYAISPIPTLSMYAAECNPSNAQMYPSFTIDGANLDLYRYETQVIYVQLGIKSLTTGQFFSSVVYYGMSKGQDNSFAPQWDHVQDWYELGTNRRAVALWGHSLAWNINQHGTYQIALRFAWDESSSGARESRYYMPSTNGWTNWGWEAGTCTY